MRHQSISLTALETLMRLQATPAPAAPPPPTLGEASDLGAHLCTHPRIPGRLQGCPQWPGCLQSTAYAADVARVPDVVALTVTRWQRLRDLLLHSHRRRPAVSR